MNRSAFSLAALFLSPLLFSSIQAATLTLSVPQNFQVVQRFSREKGRLLFSGVLAEMAGRKCGLEARVGEYGKEADWQMLLPSVTDGDFQTSLEVPAGGWYQVEFRAREEQKVLAEVKIEHVGVGEVFVVAGQSNSANYGAEKHSSQTGKVAAFDGKKWQLSQDPQPGAGGSGGSFIPILGDFLADELHVPIAFVALGAGGTRVRAWIPKRGRIP